MNKQTVKARIENIGIVPIIRVSSSADARFAGEAVVAAGIPVVEVTMTVPGAVEVIHSLVKSQPDLIVGAGTVLDAETARRCIEAGASYVTSPGVDREVEDYAQAQGVLNLAGALTPSELVTAWKNGADMVKIYPCSALGGVSYIKTLRSPFPHIPLMAAGGVNQTNALDYFRAGATVIGVGSALIAPDAIRRREAGWIREMSRRFLQIVHEARELMKG